MGELISGGYQTLRDFANSSVATPNSWDYIEVYDDSMNSVTRVSITGDSRCEWLDVDGDAILQVRMKVEGGDSDISLPVTLEYSAVWNAASGGTQISEKEQFPTATLNQAGDYTTITHTIEIPDQQ